MDDGGGAHAINRSIIAIRNATQHTGKGSDQQLLSNSPTEAQTRGKLAQTTAIDSLSTKKLLEAIQPRFETTNQTIGAGAATSVTELK